MYNWPERKPQRLKNFDYSSKWWYFLTFCTKNREKHLGMIQDGRMVLNPYGQIVENEIIRTMEMRKNEITIHEFVIMPNHVHMMIFIVGNDRVVPDGNMVVPINESVVPDNRINRNNTIIRNDAVVPYEFRPNELIPKIIKWIKSSISRWVNDIQKDFIFSWQKSYYDHIIRNEDELVKIQQYIIDNPKNWEEDSLFSE